jgi:hypothetical protein
MIQKRGAFLANLSGSFILVGDMLQADVTSRPAAEDAGAHAHTAKNGIAQQAEIEVFERVWERAATAGARLPQNDFPGFSGLGHC